MKMHKLAIILLTCSYLLFALFMISDEVRLSKIQDSGFRIIPLMSYLLIFGVIIFLLILWHYKVNKDFSQQTKFTSFIAIVSLIVSIIIILSILIFAYQCRLIGSGEWCGIQFVGSFVLGTAMILFSLILILIRSVLNHFKK